MSDNVKYRLTSSINVRPHYKKLTVSRPLLRATCLLLLHRFSHIRDYWITIILRESNSLHNYKWMVWPRHVRGMSRGNSLAALPGKPLYFPLWDSSIHVSVVT